MIVMTNLILLIGAGLFSRSIWEFESNAFAKLVGSDVDDTGGDGPGSFDVRNSVVCILFALTPPSPYPTPLLPFPFRLPPSIPPSVIMCDDKLMLWQR